MRHLLLIDPLEKLNIKKDSSLMLALTLKQQSEEVFLCFEQDFAIHNQGPQQLKVWDFDGSFREDGIYLKELKLTQASTLELGDKDLLHMRLDPPFDSRYLRILWMLDHLCELGVRVLNHPRGIMQFNEKLYAYRTPGACPSFVGESLELARHFLNQLEPRPDSVILKPLDLYSGIGVEKLTWANWEQRFEAKVKELKGPLVVQPFQAQVAAGEVRSVYFMGQELGSILKVPPRGEFLSNIAQGASFSSTKLSDLSRQRCEQIVSELQNFGVEWVAFDILGEAISEVNITCPGLLVEVSFAHQKNLASEVIKLINQKF
jgi:glutathione synthase